MTQRLLNLRRADTKRNGGERGEAGEIDSARKLKQKDGGKKRVSVAGGKSRVCPERIYIWQKWQEGSSGSNFRAVHTSTGQIETRLDLFIHGS